MTSPPFTGAFDVAQFPIIDPEACDEVSYNGFTLRLQRGVPPHYERLLYVEFSGQSKLIGRFIKDYNKWWIEEFQAFVICDRTNGGFCNNPRESPESIAQLQKQLGEFVEMKLLLAKESMNE